MTHDNLGIKDRFVAAVYAGDADTMRSLLDPSFEIHQPPGLAYAGSYAGADGFLSFIGRFMATYDIENLLNTDTFVSSNPDRVVLEFQFAGKVKASGEKFATSLMERWEFRDGRILRITVFWFAIPGVA